MRLERDDSSAESVARHLKAKLHATGVPTDLIAGGSLGHHESPLLLAVASSASLRPGSAGSDDLAAEAAADEAERPPPGRAPMAGLRFVGAAARVLVGKGRAAASAAIGLELRREAKDVDRHADETRFKGAHVKGELRRVSPEASRAGA